MTYIFAMFVIGVIFAFWGGSFSSAKGHSYGEGFALSFLLGMIGSIFLVV